MRRTAAVFALALLSLAAAAFAALRPRFTGQDPKRDPPSVARAGVLSISAQLDRAFVSETRGGEAYLEVIATADGSVTEGAKVPVNAVLILDRSGSMSGEKLARAKDAARELLSRLDGDDRFSLIDFGSSARVLVPSMSATGAAKERALQLVNALEADGGTNLSAALELAGPQLRSGYGTGRVNKVFLASDGQANEGVSSRVGLMIVARTALGDATVSTFGVGEDYDEDMMTALASQAGGMTHYIQRADEIVPAFRAELQRAAKVVARNVRLVVQPAAGARVEKVIGYESDGGWVRLPDFSAGERRRILVKLQLPPGHGRAELAKVNVSFVADDGAQATATTAAAATYTPDEQQASNRKGQAAYQGARAEMAVVASEAASLAASGRTVEVRDRMAKLSRLNAFAQENAPKDADKQDAERELKKYEGLVGGIGAGAPGAAAPPPAKALKQHAFDAIRAAY